MRASVHATLILLSKVSLWGDKKYELANFTKDELVAAARAVAALGTHSTNGRVPLRRDPSVLGRTTRGPRAHR